MPESPTPSQEQVMTALKTVPYPGFSRDIVSFGLVRGIETADGRVSVTIEVTTNKPDVPDGIRAAVTEAVSSMDGVDQVTVDVRVQPPESSPEPAQAAAGLPEQTRIPGVGRVIAVASGKGGVGKSTVAVNLACALLESGRKVGLLDCDIYGPSIPLMMGTSERPGLAGDRIQPVSSHGIRLMSLGFILDDDAPVIWRGPMVTKVVRQFLQDTDWSGLDCLVIDLPPGTGDAQLTLVQTIPLDGAVVVTTPQDVSLVDARKGVAMFQKTGVPILGIVENMSGFACPHCGEVTPIFGEGGGRRESERLGVPFLGGIPIDPSICVSGDTGRPTVVGQPDSPTTAAFRAAAAEVAQSASIPAEADR